MPGVTDAGGLVIDKAEPYLIQGSDVANLLFRGNVHVNTADQLRTAFEDH